ncbi:hypothetical protein BU23DRAFT_247107 [Bimuria novae-zelandiae CBS 107.79]|uniref:Uncharacterized protein n=1 Tax=Bimuria novae-zelandiae CBS 107.79 TaxID=1447943 RepID=A0A6A5UVF9_9PLEO|nr:hypothetical protein BU23DRAFT_247107 [Bimuria novae-zelandiae CBS 107.79]
MGTRLAAARSTGRQFGPWLRMAKDTPPGARHTIPGERVAVPARTTPMWWFLRAPTAPPGGPQPGTHAYAHAAKLRLSPGSSPTDADRARPVTFVCVLQDPRSSAVQLSGTWRRIERQAKVHHSCTPSTRSSRRQHRCIHVARLARTALLLFKATNITRQTNLPTRMNTVALLAHDMKYNTTTLLRRF